MRKPEDAIRDLYIRVEQLEAYISYLKTKMKVEKIEPQQLLAEEIRDNGAAV